MTERIVAFLREIGLTVKLEAIEGSTFLPGINIRAGVLVVDRNQLLFAGDVLHEAGHLAVMDPEQRTLCNGDAGVDGGYEMAAIAWSYAAARIAGIPVEVLFHDAGYRGGAAALRESFEAGRGVGVPMLEWLGMVERGQYPLVKKWVR